MRGDPNVGADSTKLRFSFGDTIQYNKAYQWVYPDVLYRHTWVYSNGQISLYVNGEQLGDTTTATFDGQPTHFEINGHSSVDATTGMGTLPMKVYGVNVFNKALDATELASLWDNNNNVSVTNTSTSTSPLVDGGLYRVVVVATDDTQPTTNVGIGFNEEWLGIIAFHHEIFVTDTYGYRSIVQAANEGQFFADTPPGSYSGGVLEAVTMTTSTVENTYNDRTTYTWNPAGKFTCDVLMVAGGGGGGSYYGGGGGAGGILFYEKEVLSSNTKTIVVGAGGL
eukprot:1885950-Pyramimonas_sp.AAC.1